MLPASPASCGFGSDSQWSCHAKMHECATWFSHTATTTVISTHQRGRPLHRTCSCTRRNPAGRWPHPSRSTASRQRSSRCSRACCPISVRRSNTNPDQAHGQPELHAFHIDWAAQFGRVYSARWPHPRHLQQRTGHRFLDGFHAGLLAEVVRTQQTEVVVRVRVVERQDQVDQRLAAAAQVQSTSATAGWTESLTLCVCCHCAATADAHRCRLAAVLNAVHFCAAHLLASLSGPMGLLPMSCGEDPSATSASRLRDSFLSSPASLPADGARAG